MALAMSAHNIRYVYRQLHGNSDDNCALSSLRPADPSNQKLAPIGTAFCS